ncbi:MAG TPA: hypothetical protein VMW72_11350 [Sedimentisphaerales bacterium]|nr:hypothetical protein [Sedimentisphaerales bacterium]
MKISIGSGAIIIVSQRSQSDIPAVSEVVRKLRSIAVHSLARMYRPKERLFAFRLRRNGKGEVLEGVSQRYTATALIGLAGEDQHIAAEVLGNNSRHDVCGQLIADCGESQEMGEVALTTWAARMLQHPHAHEAVETLKGMDPAGGAYPTVELSWALTALVIDGSEATDMAIAERIADSLMDSFRQESGIFPHEPAKKGLSALRAHISCFADFLYPIQALSYYYLVTGDARAAEIACRCADRMCQLQGPKGQWWWHFDIRTGRVVEYYPVYSVHQDSMAPMALFALAKACDRDYSESIEKGLRWLFNPLEIPGSLIDTERNIIWRKVARREPCRLVRYLQAAASRLHPAIRMPAVDAAFPLSSIDYESRPYHMGWIVHAWPANRT